jgi:hypothetical protein
MVCPHTRTRVQMHHLKVNRTNQGNRSTVITGNRRIAACDHRHLNDGDWSPSCRIGINEMSKIQRHTTNDTAAQGGDRRLLFAANCTAITRCARWCRASIKPSVGNNRLFDAPDEPNCSALVICLLDEYWMRYQDTGRAEIEARYRLNRDRLALWENCNWKNDEGRKEEPHWGPVTVPSRCFGRNEDPV